MTGRQVRRFLSAGTASIVGVVVALGAQSAPRRPGPEARVVDPKALSILQAMDDAFRRLEGLAAEYRSESSSPSGRKTVESVSLRLGRPNVYSVKTTMDGSAFTRMLASDGTTRYGVTISGSTTRCTASDVSPLNDTREIDTFNPLYWSFYDLGQWQIRSAMLGHWSTPWRLADPGLRTVTYVGRADLLGVPVDVVEWTYTIGYSRPEDDPVYTSRLSIGVDDHLVRRIVTTSTSRDEYEGRRIVETISEIRTSPRPAPSEFAFTPPAGVACPRVNQEDVYTTGEYADLPIGSKAPDFTLKTSRGETVHLAEFLRRHKVVLMNYWGYG